MARTHWELLRTNSPSSERRHIMLGSTYAIVALGLTLVFGILHIPNFAHGNIYMLGAYLTFFLITSLGIGFWAVVISSMVLMSLVGILLECIVYRPLRGQSHMNSFIAAIGALLFIETLVVSIWGPQEQYSHIR